MVPYIEIINYPDHDCAPDLVIFQIPEWFWKDWNKYRNLKDAVRAAIESPVTDREDYDFIQETYDRIEKVAKQFNLSYKIITLDSSGIDAGY